MKFPTVVFGLLVVASLLIYGCAASQEPKLIAAFPNQGQSSAPQPPSAPEQFVYNASLELQVLNPQSSAEKARKLAEAYAGYLVSSQTYRWQNGEQVTVVLAVPAASYERLHADLLQLGRLVSERVSGGWEGSGLGVYSEITLTFTPGFWAQWEWPGGWNPGRTFQQAWGVFIAIFGFLVDILIWVAVVLGPFALLGYLVYRILQRKIRRI
jgi:hypothetical protein